MANNDFIPWSQRLTEPADYQLRRLREEAAQALVEANVAEVLIIAGARTKGKGASGDVRVRFVALPTKTQEGIQMAQVEDITPTIVALLTGRVAEERTIRLGFMVPRRLLISLPRLREQEAWLADVWWEWELWGCNVDGPGWKPSVQILLMELTKSTEIPAQLIKSVDS